MKKHMIEIHANENQIERILDMLQKGQSRNIVYYDPTTAFTITNLQSVRSKAEAKK